MGYYGGKPVILKVGKYLLLNERDLERTEKFFHRKQGAMTVFISRFVPVVRHFVSIPAGMGRMPLMPFLAVTFIGATIWNTFLLVCGMKLRDNWKLVQKYSHQVDLVVVVAVLAVCVWFVRNRLATRKARLQQADPG
jgi:membrane protein DedA with SNARE-associated domain